MPGLTLRTLLTRPLTAREVDERNAVRWVKAGHGWSFPRGLKLDATAGWALAQADAEANLPHGLMVFAEDANTVWIATLTGQIVLWESHGFGASGTLVYTHQASAGLFTASKPESGIRDPFLVVVDPSNVMILRGPRELL